jgi:hypothetical protein
MLRFRCRQCGVVYEGAVATQKLALILGPGCRRCGGELEPEARRFDRGRAPRGSVRAVRSAVTGRERLPFG